jgi:hypothetical protein
MKKLFTLILFAALWAGISFAQDYQIRNLKMLKTEPALNKGSEVTDYSTYQSPKKPGHYSTEDWHALIDSFWGPGVSTPTKLAVFDDFWNAVDQSWGGFPNLDINWDSLRSVYRPIVEAGVSRGRFAGILSRLTQALQEWHTGVFDRGIDSTLGFYSPFWKGEEYPNNQSFYYSPGIPIININSLLYRTNFGAGLTPLPDSSILVYSVMSNHPLGLQPGDIILGYDGIPWMQLLNDLFRAELPILTPHPYGTYLGASTAAANHAAMISVGMNWGLFDTIDVVKYPNNDTVHYPTSLLAAITPPYLVATEQLPVKGIPFPDIQGNKLFSWGIVEGTNIGYIYAWDFEGVPDGQTRVLFGQAVDELMHINKVNGLILDFRKNPNGSPDYANDGSKHLFNVDPAVNYSSARRIKGNDHYDFTIDPGTALGKFTPTPEVFDHPIAVLLGPSCGSSGDYIAFRFRFHPMARSFGKPTNGAYTADPFNGYGYNDPYEWRVDGGCVYSNVNNEGYMIHKSFPVDEEIWLTRDGVAKGEDDVVKRALEWINNMSYAHTVTLNKSFLTPGLDTLLIVSAIVENPDQHPLNVSAVLTDDNNINLDSIGLYDDGLHHDGEAGDKVWANAYINNTEQTILVSVSTEDTVAGDKRCLQNVLRATSVGPVVFEGIRNITPTDQEVNPGDNLRFKIKVRNNGTTATAINIMAHVVAVDTCGKISEKIDYKFGDIPPGTSTEGTTPAQYIKFNKNCGDCTARFALEILSNNYPFWSDTFTIDIIATGIPENESFAEEFHLEQNYPNPFSSTTTISYQLSQRSHVLLKVYDIQGREVTTLVDKIEMPGNKSVELNAEGWPGGIYYYRMQAGGYIQTRKLILLR